LIWARSALKRTDYDCDWCAEDGLESRLCALDELRLRRSGSQPRQEMFDCVNGREPSSEPAQVEDRSDSTVYPRKRGGDGQQTNGIDPWRRPARVQSLQRRWWQCYSCREEAECRK